MKFNNIGEVLRECCARDSYSYEEATKDIISLILESLPKEKDTSRQNMANALYTPPPQDGDTVTFTHINYDERNGWNNCLKEMRERVSCLK